jgi:hypothetical protein
LAYNIELIIFGINLLILFEDDTFKECGRSNYGGSIYVVNNGANFVIVNSESIKSHATSHGLFLYTGINSALKYNFVLYCTISESYYSSGSPTGTIWLQYGQIRIISTNSSDNVCYWGSSFRLDGMSNSGYSDQLNYSTDNSYIHYCYMLNNYANGCTCLILYYNRETCEESNIINNSQGTTNYGTVSNNNIGYDTIIAINKCCLIKNNEKGSGKYLFAVCCGTIEVNECKIQSGYKVSAAGTYSIITSYSNTEAGSECAKIYNCGARIDRSCEQCRCSVYDNILINNLQRLYANKPFLI